MKKNGAQRARWKARNGAGVWGVPHFGLARFFMFTPHILVQFTLFSWPSSLSFVKESQLPSLQVLRAQTINLSGQDNRKENTRNQMRPGCLNQSRFLKPIGGGCSDIKGHRSRIPPPKNTMKRIRVKARFSWEKALQCTKFKTRT